MHKLALTLTFLDADFDRGVLFWKTGVASECFGSDKCAARYATKYAGREVRTHRINTFGHRSVQIRHHGGSENVLVHRAIWALAHGEFPVLHIDHINNDPADNRLVNLRPATRGQNNTNSRRSKRGLKGAYKDKDGRWFSSAWDGKRLQHLGMFDTEHQAHAAWLNAKAEIAGAFFNPGYKSVFD